MKLLAASSLVFFLVIFAKRSAANGRECTKELRTCVEKAEGNTDSLVSCFLKRLRCSGWDPGAAASDEQLVEVFSDEIMAKVLKEIPNELDEFTDDSVEDSSGESSGEGTTARPRTRPPLPPFRKCATEFLSCARARQPISDCFQKFLKCLNLPTLPTARPGTASSRSPRTHRPWTLPTRRPWTWPTRRPWSLPTRRPWTWPTRRPWTLPTRRPWTWPTRRPWTWPTRRS